MSYLLDTCVLSKLRKEIPHQTREWFAKKEQDFFYISVVTIAELWDGINRLPNSKKKRDLEDWFHGDVHSRFKNHILPIDDRIAIEWGIINAKLLNKGISVGVQDLYIAATAKSLGMELVTLNIRDFNAIDISIINPWDLS